MTSMPSRSVNRLCGNDSRTMSVAGNRIRNASRPVKYRRRVLSRITYVTHPDANKGAVVLSLAKMLGIPAEEIATIGDMPNDITMFALSGSSIAMGQSSEEVKQAATFVTTSSEEEGFANAMDRYVLENI